MNSLERIQAVSAGEIPDRLPTISLQKDCDLQIVSDAETAESGQLYVSLVLSPFGRALNDGVPILQLLADDPTTGSKKVAEYEEASRKQMQTAMDKGATGIFYFLMGASPATASPMEYGGHFLEVDRRLLEEFAQASFNVLYVDGNADPYVDFVSDLPAHGFAWDDQSNVDRNEVKKVRIGAIMGEGFLLNSSSDEIHSKLLAKVTCS